MVEDRMAVEWEILHVGGVWPLSILEVVHEVLEFEKVGGAVENVEGVEGCFELENAELELELENVGCCSTP